jgi:hypothetical protein
MGEARPAEADIQMGRADSKHKLPLVDGMIVDVSLAICRALFDFFWKKNQITQ